MPSRHEATDVFPVTGIIPSLATLSKYGLTEDTFMELLRTQDYVCAICKNKPNGRWNIDHEHVKGWKNMPAEKRVLYVRGLLCWFCNRYYVGRSITIAKAENVVEYLKNYQKELAERLR